MDGTRWGLVELNYIFSSMENRALLKYFHVQIKQSCKSERLVVFFWYGRDQMGPGGAEIYIFNDERCLIADMWYWWWLLILLNFAVILCFWLSLLIK